jgi:beta-glucosidase
MLFTDFKSPRVPDPLWYATITGTFVPDFDGLYDFGLCVYGTANLYVNDELLVDNTHNQKQGTVFYGCGTLEEISLIEMKKDTPYAIRVEFASAPTNTLGSGGVVRFGGGGIRIGGARRIDPKEEIAFAVKAAKQADQVVVCAGLNSDWEGEGHDRANMQLPGHMDELIAAVAKANPNTVVVMQTGSPVEMPWIEDVSAVLQAWYGGNETGNAMADALFGDINPSGKSSLSWPRNVEHNPAFLNYRSEAGRTLYGDDVYIGYRYYESVSRDVLFPFGHGLSYTTFALSNLNVSVSNDSATISVTTSVENTGAITGAEVLQIYVSQTSPSIRRAPKELQGFEKVFLQPKEKKNVTVTMPLKYVTGYWDEARAMWVCEKGRYVVQAGTSSQGVFLEGGFDVKETFWWKGL